MNIWTDEEFIVCLYFYLTHDVNISKKDPELIEFCQRCNLISPIKRTNDSRYFRLMNYRYVDPSQNGTGLSGGAKLCKKYWDKYANDRNTLKKIYNEFIEKTNKIDYEIFDEIAKKIIKNKNFTTEEKDAYIKTLIKTRNPLFQQYFRNNLILEFNSKCALCEIDIPAILRASHSLDYRECIKKEDMVNSNNGLLLCPTHDALFDKKLITFDQDGCIIISKTIKKEIYKQLNISESFVLDKAFMNNERKEFLKKHRKKFDENEKN